MIFNTTIENLDSEFEAILEKSIVGIEEKFNGVEKSKVLGTAFEREVCDILNEHSIGTHFNKKFEQTSTYTFPDIFSKVMENKWYGVEVKTSQKGWKCFGNSIFETTRVDNLSDRIYLFYGNFKDDLKCRWSKYEEAIETINITHSPRYHIDMDISVIAERPTVFDRMSITYSQFANADIETRMKLVRELKRNELGRSAALWWLPEADAGEDTFDSNLNIKQLSSLSISEKDMIRCKSMVLFPEIFGSKYQNVIIWLASEYGVVSHSLRDLYTAGGKHEIRIDGRIERVGRIFKHVESNIYLIKEIIENLTEFEIQNYCTYNIDQRNLLNAWIEAVSVHYKNYDIFNWLYEIAKR